MPKKIGNYIIGNQKSKIKVPVLEDGQVDLSGIYFSNYIVTLFGFVNLYDVNYCRLYIENSLRGKDFDFTLSEISPNIAESGVLYAHMPLEEKFLFKKDETKLRVGYQTIRPNYVILNYCMAIYEE